MPRNVSERFCYYHSQMCTLYNSHLCSAYVKRGKHFQNAEYAYPNNQYRPVCLMLTSSLSLPHFVFYSILWPQAESPVLPRQKSLRREQDQHSRVSFTTAYTAAQVRRGSTSSSNTLQTHWSSQLPEYILYSLRVPLLP